MPNNLNSLYSFNNNVSVSSNNFTTLYNSTTGNISTGNVSQRNFTTLYSNQVDIDPTKPYGNANVEAFLNAGSDIGGNVVQNINMSGTITVGGESYLGLVGNVHIDGGTYNSFLTTDGNGGLSWTTQTLNEKTPFIHFDVTINGNNQQFTDANIAFYSSVDYINLFKNGINIEPFYFQLINPTTVQVDLELSAGDTIDILASGGGSAAAAGSNNEVQFNFDGFLAANNQFTYDQITNILTVGNITTTSIVANTIQVTDAVSNTLVFFDDSGNINPAGGFTSASYPVFDLDGTYGYYAGTIDNNTALALYFMNTTESDSFIASNPTTIVINDTAITGNNWTVPKITSVFYPFGPGTPYVQIVHTDGVVNNGPAVGNVTVQNTGIEFTANLATGLDANIANVSISGGFNGYVLSTDGVGNLSWVSGGGGGGNGTAVGGPNAIQFANAIAPTNFDGSQDFTFTKQTSTTYDTSWVHINSNTDPNAGFPDFSRISFDRDGTEGTGYGRLDGQYLDFYTTSSERHTSDGGFSFVGPNPTVAPTSIVMAGNIDFNEAWFSPVIGTVKLGNVANVQISGGSSGYVLRTNGSNVLSWTNTIANSTYATSAGTASTAGTVTTNAQPNITSTGTLTGLTVSNATGVVNFTTTANVTLGAVANLHISGGSSGQYLSTNGSGTLSWGTPASASGISNGTSNVNITTSNGNVTVGVNGVSGIATFADSGVTFTGTTTIQQAKEKVTSNATGSTGTINYDVLTQAIITKTANATANFTLNVRGNSTVTFNNTVSSNESMTLTFVNKNGTTGYVLTALQIDSTSQTLLWAGGVTPTVGTTSGYDVYNFNIIKTAANTYAVFATVGGYK